MSRSRAPLLYPSSRDGRLPGRRIAPFEETGYGGLSLRAHRTGVAPDVTVLGHRHNAFGPLQPTDPHPREQGPDVWPCAGAKCLGEYQLKPLGLLAPPRLGVSS